MQVHLAETASTCLLMQQRSQYATSVPAMRGGLEVSARFLRSFEFLQRDDKTKVPMIFSDARRRAE